MRDRVELSPGTRFGGYTIVSVLGRGGMGVVYEADDPKRARRVALKVISRVHSSDESFMSRFRREGRAAEAVSHPNVVALLDAGEQSGSAYLVFELVSQGSLSDLLKERGALPWREAASLGAGVARGLAAVHAAGLVHRDVKPSNVLLDRRGPRELGEPKLADFGLVSAHSASLAVTHALTRTGEVVGTLEFMAPEQANASGSVTELADLYSLGALLYALLTGRPPFSGTGYALMKKHMTEAPRPPREEVAEVPERLESLVLALLEKRPEARPRSAASVARELDEIACQKLPGRSRLAAIVAVSLGPRSSSPSRGRNPRARRSRPGRPRTRRPPRSRPTSRRGRRPKRASSPRRRARSTKPASTTRRSRHRRGPSTSTRRSGSRGWRGAGAGARRSSST
ncbi:serine/threonine protein kinase [bacterium]|nr:serine/threonine protein kinase [bacterium]